MKCETSYFILRLHFYFLSYAFISYNLNEYFLFKTLLTCTCFFSRAEMGFHTKHFCVQQVKIKVRVPRWIHPTQIHVWHLSDGLCQKLFISVM